MLSKHIHLLHITVQTSPGGTCSTLWCGHLSLTRWPTTRAGSGTGQASWSTAGLGSAFWTPKPWWTWLTRPLGNTYRRRSSASSGTRPSSPGVCVCENMNEWESEGVLVWITGLVLCSFLAHTSVYSDLDGKKCTCCPMSSVEWAGSTASSHSFIYSYLVALTLS